MQVLLTKEPAAVNIVAATKETAIFWAVKNDHVDCARLLLQAGANRLLVNLRYAPLLFT
jgi:ankyrin repeat protein